MNPLFTRYFYGVAVLCLLLLRSGPAWAQATTVSGTVTDAKTRQPLPYVSVAVPAAGVGVNTDDNGHYSLQVPAPEYRGGF